ncbi:uromodulin-like [Ambystoma mexicanum]|uniref:uromodulin-like n=1 Tax=Ambystoma mexicanum TaxID=8296 RepID=UPI0037E9A676
MEEDISNVKEIQAEAMKEEIEFWDSGPTGWKCGLNAAKRLEMQLESRLKLPQHSTADARACSDCDSDAICQPKWNYVRCGCKAGFTGNGFQCTKTSDCLDIGCCPPGYTWHNQKGNERCVDVDECLEPSLNKCTPPSTCSNVGGNHVCVEDRSIPCNITPCNGDVDCLSVNGEMQCADPCSNYQELNGTGRMSNISSDGRFQSDNALYGWFRYTGGAGVKMKEGCIGGLKCGSAEPFTLAAGHPALGAGILNVPIQINLLSGACTSFGYIPVKACIGNFYVYKFLGSLKSEVFCTDWTG